MNDDLGNFYLNQILGSANVITEYDRWLQNKQQEDMARGTHVLESAGRWLANTLRRSQREHGTRHAAARARKMGIPVSLALLILVGRV